jgi:hypothetical protein
MRRHDGARLSGVTGVIFNLGGLMKIEQKYLEMANSLTNIERNKFSYKKLRNDIALTIQTAVNEAVIKARTCYSCGETDLVCGKGWREEREILVKKYISATKDQIKKGSEIEMLNKRIFDAIAILKTSSEPILSEIYDAISILEGADDARI